MNNELSYWLALALTPTIRTKKKNDILVRLHKQEKALADFFHASETQWKEQFDITDKEKEHFRQSVTSLPNYAFLAEELLNQGYNIVPITSKDYSPILKKNLGKTYAPPVLYTKGNLQMMREDAIAIVGSRNATSKSLDFTDQVAKKATEEYKVVVSGFAKGVDKQALDSALKYNGRSIIVLPQGIMTFQSGYKKYYKQIVDGDVLVVSTFFPKATWSVQLAMARNPIIYGLANEIYVAESSAKGGTWSGVMDGLKKERKIYVRKPESNEKNANALLLSHGAEPVNEFGERMSSAIENITVGEPKQKSEEESIDVGQGQQSLF